MGLKKKLELNVLTEAEAQSIREGFTSQSMGRMKDAIRQLDLQLESDSTAPAKKKEVEAVERYVGTELAEVARDALEL